MCFLVKHSPISLSAADSFGGLPLTGQRNHHEESGIGRGGLPETERGASTAFPCTRSRRVPVRVLSDVRLTTLPPHLFPLPHSGPVGEPEQRTWPDRSSTARGRRCRGGHGDHSTSSESTGLIPDCHRLRLLSNQKIMAPRICYRRLHP